MNMISSLANLFSVFLVAVCFFSLSVLGATSSSSATLSNSKVNSTNASRARGSRSGLDPNYGLWQQHAGAHSMSGFGRQDMIPLIPIALLFGLGLMLIPFLSSFIAQVLAPASPPVYTGRKRRDANSSPLNSNLITDTVFSYLKTLQKSFEMYGLDS